MADNDNDEYNDHVLEQLEALETSLVRPRQTRLATRVLPELMLNKAMTLKQQLQASRDTTISVVIEAPSRAWVEPLATAAKRLGSWKFVLTCTEPEKARYRNELPSDQAIQTLAAGGRTLGISQAPHAYLPPALVASADLYLVIKNPDDELIRAAIKLVTGRQPRSMPEGIADGLDYADICAALRLGSSAKACVERLAAAAQAKTASDPNLADVPELEKLNGYGPAMSWAQGVVADLAAWRRGELDFSAIERSVVLASPPGMGKSTLIRSLAKTARIPLIATSMSEWFANGPGYLDSVIKQIDQTFAQAAAVAPSIVFIDECEGIPNRGNLDGDRSAAWWMPVVGHLLLKLDSAASGLSSKVIIVGATNHPEKLDPALVRPGRLSKIIHIEPPDAEALNGILHQHLGQDLAGEDLRHVAMLGVGSTGADVTGWIKGARSVARQENRPVTIQDLINQVAPPDTRSPALLRRIAVHEAAHAVVSHVLHEGSVTGVSIIARQGQNGGHTAMVFNEDAVLSREDIEKLATINLAGRCGEQSILGSISTGAGGGEKSDLATATYFLALIHTSFGMGGHLLHRAAPQNVSQLLSFDPVLAKTVEADLQRVYASSLQIVEANRLVVEAVAEALLQFRHLSGPQFAAIFRGISKTTRKIAGGRHG